MAAFEIDFAGIEQALAAIAQVQQRAGSVGNAVLRDTGLIIQSEVDQVFATSPSTTSGGTVYGGEVWDRLTDAYLKRRRDRVGGQILRDTGELLNSLAVGGGGNILQSGGNTVTFGSALPKARGLQRDRPFLFATDTMARIVAKRWELYVTEGR